MKSIENENLNATQTEEGKQGVELLSNREFYYLIEKFCLEQAGESSQYNSFLNRYFNDEGYVDHWRIPNLMLDVIQQNVQFQPNMANPEFRSIFQNFLVDLYNFCLNACQPFAQSKSSQDSASDSLQKLKEQQQFTQSLMQTFIQVMEQLSSKEKSEDAA